MYMKNNIILFAVATLALNSCGIYKKYEPVATLPENLYREEIAPADTFSIGNISWRDLFTDPALQSLIERGLANNTDLRIAHLKVQEAEAALMPSRLSYLPSLSLDPQGTTSSFDKAKASWTYNVPVSASWEIDIFGRLTNAKRQAKAALSQSQAYSQAVQTQLIANIANLDAGPAIRDHDRNRREMARKPSYHPSINGSRHDYRGGRIANRGYLLLHRDLC